MKVGPVDLELIKQASERENICLCCTRTTSRQVLSMNCNSKQLSHLGPGYPLYFSFIKFSIVLTVVLFIISGGYNLFTNIYNGNQCTDSYQAGQAVDYKYSCRADWITLLSVGNKKNETLLLEIQDILNMASVVIIIVCFQFFRTYIRKTDSLVDKIDISSEDYTLLIKDIPVIASPLSGEYHNDLKNHLENNLLKNKTVDITRINFTYDLQEMNQLLSKRKVIINLKKDAIHHRYVFGEYKANQSVYKYDQQIQEIENVIDSLSQKYYYCRDAETMKAKFTGWAFVSLSSAVDRDEVLQQYDGKKNFLKFSSKLDYKGFRLVVESAPSPSDVFWDNLHVKSQILRMLFSFAVLAGVLAGSFFLVQYLMKLQRKIKSESIVVIYDVATTLQLSSIALSFIINTINIVIKHLCLFLTRLERLKTRTSYYISAIKKIVLGQFCVSALVIFGNQLFLIDEDGSYFERIFNSGGLVYNIQYVFITNAFINISLELLNIPGIIKSIKRYFAIRSSEKQTNFMTQQQLNDLFEDPEFSIILRYALMIKTIFIMAFYAPIIPICLPWIALTLGVNYWIDKYSLLRRRVVKYNISLLISVEMTEMLEFALIIYCAGNILFFVFVMGNTKFSDASIYQYVSAGLGIVHAAFPMHWLNKKLFKVTPAPPNTEAYKSVYAGFITDYERENPATSVITKYNYVNRTTLVKQGRRSIASVAQKNDKRSSLAHVPQIENNSDRGQNNRGSLTNFVEKSDKKDKPDKKQKSTVNFSPQVEYKE